MKRLVEVGSQSEPAGLVFYRWLRDEIITESNTDTIIETVVDVLPVPSIVSRWVLDMILPDALLYAVRKVLQRIGQLPSDRYLSPLNPFTRDLGGEDA